MAGEITYNSYRISNLDSQFSTVSIGGSVSTPETPIEGDFM
jgi:hypothetical protein